VVIKKTYYIVKVESVSLSGIGFWWKRIKLNLVGFHIVTVSVLGGSESVVIVKWF